ncbi:Hypothetical predicted protein [Mytilus galloprovincialis]|uniref:CARD domain-containing protein n=1 Tax=Mytilus galloprovincialis TaxID=29158 RepID=A0A8B6CTI0_MYTGA|nr:Hypothetical predicted protein [Mytilus galloprovincialis]
MKETDMNPSQNSQTDLQSVDDADMNPSHNSQTDLQPEEETDMNPSHNSQTDLQPEEETDMNPSHNSQTDLQSREEADKNPSHNSQTDLQSIEEADKNLTHNSQTDLQLVEEADKHPSQNSQTEKQSLSSSKTEFQGRNTDDLSNKPEPIQTEEDNLLQAACTIIYTVPRAIEHFIDREYEGGFRQAIRNYKDQLRTKLRSEEWDILSKLIVNHRLYHFYDQIIQDTILDNEVLDLLISRCILRKEDRAEIEHHPRQSDRNKCILDFLILRPEDSYNVLLEVLKESSTCSKNLIEFPGFHSVRIQKNYHNLTQNLSNTECIIDSLISKGIINPDDRSEIVSSGVQTKINRKLIDYVRSEQDYQFFLTALTEDPSNAKLASDLELTNITSDELKLLQTGAILPSLTNAPGFQTMVTLVSMVTVSDFKYKTRKP